MCPNGEKVGAAETQHTEEAFLGELSKLLDYKLREIVEESGIAPEVALERSYYLEKTKAGLKRLGFKRGQQRAPAIVISRFAPSGEEIPPQIKPDSHNIKLPDGSFEERKYETAAGSGVRLSVHPRTVKYLRDVRYELWVTEGDKKGDSLVSRGAVAVVLQGVGCWDVPQDWEEIKLYGRTVVIAFDADVMHNQKVARELEKLSAFLKERRANVRYLVWPEKYRGTKTGVDDYLAAGDGTVQDLYRMAQEAPDEGAMIEDVCAAEVTTEPVEWLWKGRLPYGKLAIFDGDPDKGKTMVTLDIAARTTRGRAFPDGSPCEPGNVLIVNVEDGAADTIVPRLKAAGADLNRVYLFSGVPDDKGGTRLLELPQDIGLLRSKVEERDAALMILDPVITMLGGDANKDQDARKSLAPVRDMAEATGAAVIGVRHLNKTVGLKAIQRGGGNMGLIGVARAGAFFAEHPEDDTLRVMAQHKSNLAEKPPSLAYRIVTSLEHNTARVEWAGQVEHDADALAASGGTPHEKTELENAKEFLRDELGDGPVHAKQIFKNARDAGVSEITLRRAKLALGVKSARQGEEGWTWYLPDKPTRGDHDPTPKDDHHSRRDHDDHVDHLQKGGSKGSENPPYIKEDDHGDHHDHRVCDDHHDRLGAAPVSEYRQGSNGRVQHDEGRQDRQAVRQGGPGEGRECIHGVIDGCWLCRGREAPSPPPAEDIDGDEGELL